MNAIAQFQVDSKGLPDAELLSAAWEACPEGLAVVESSRILCANRAFAQLFGFPQSSEIQGRALAELMPQGGVCTVKQASPDDRTMLGSPAREFRVTRRDGIPLQIEMSGAGFRKGNRELQVISARDVTGQHIAQRRHRESQKMEAIGHLVGGVAHDFSNLLTGIMLYCDLLIAGLGNNRRMLHHAREIRSAGEHGTALIQQLLAVGRQQVVAPGLLSLNDVVLSLRNLLSRLIGENMEVVTELEEELGAVKMDPAQAQQIILNLVLNARDALPAGGRITVQTRNCAALFPGQSGLVAGVELSVADTGCGMDAETRSHLFEPFFTTKRPGQGCGLGLATAYGIVTQDGGTIEVESQPEKGTRVCVRLPRMIGNPARKIKRKRSKIKRGDPQ